MRIRIGFGAAVAPLIAAPVLGTTQVAKSDGRLLPALVTAEAAAHPGVGTLVLDPQQDGSVAAVVDRGFGTTLDETSTLWSTRRSVDESAHALATLAGNLSSRSGFDPVPGLATFRVEFVLLPAADGGADPGPRVHLPPRRVGVDARLPARHG